MRILMLTSTFFPQLGGIPVYVYEITKRMLAQGHNVHICVTDFEGNKIQQDSYGGIPITRISLKRNNLYKSLSNFVVANTIVKEVTNILSDKNIDIINFHNLLPLSFACRFFKSKYPIIFTNHTSGYLRKYNSFIGRIKLRFLLDYVDAIIGVSPELERKSDILVKENNIFFIPNGVDTKKYLVVNRQTDQSLLDKYGIDNDEVVVICPRRIVPKNGVRYLVEAIPKIVKKINKVKFLFVGDGVGPHKEYILEFVKQNNIKEYCIFAGFVPNEDMKFLYGISDVAVLPSLMEAVSIAGLEAMSCSLPLVGSNVGGIPCIIEDGKTGFLVPDRNPGRIAEKLILLIKDSDLRKNMGRLAREKAVKDFDWNIISHKVLTVMERYVNVRRG